MNFTEAVQGLMAGDFTRLAPLFETPLDGSSCAIIKWYDNSMFSNEPHALDEAFTCACFNRQIQVVEYLLSKGVNPNGGINTGLNAFHWAANRGQLDVVKILIQSNASLEIRNAYGGNILGCAVWSAVYEPKPHHIQIIEALLNAGAQVSATEYPSGDSRVDEVLCRYAAKKFEPFS